MSEPATPLLELRGVERGRGDGFRLHVENLRVNARGRVAIVGPSGSGKSTCLDLIAMALRPERAERMVVTPGGGTSIDVGKLWRENDRRSIRTLRARYFGYVLQTGGLVPFLSLQENAMLSRRLLAQPGGGPVEALFETLGIGHLRRRKPRRVSIGERQRAAVVRALAHEPAVVLADEPTASLDHASAADVMTLLTRTVSDRSTALVVVTHDEALAARFDFTVIRCRPDSSGRRSTIRTDPP